jgi:P4 family phage/plasmid primase-like protien
VSQLFNFILPSIQSTLKVTPIPASDLLAKIKQHKGEGYHMLFDLEKRDDYKSYQGEVSPALGWFPLDFDASVLEDAQRDVLKAYEKLHLSPDFARIYFSGCKGFHLYIRKEFFNCEESVRAYRDIASGWKQSIELPTLDISIIQANRKFRLPNSRHPKTGLYKVELSLDQLTKWTINYIRAHAESPKEITLGAYTAPEVKLMESYTTSEEKVNSPVTPESSESKTDEKPIIGASSEMPPALPKLGSFGTENAIPDDTKYAYVERPCVTRMWAVTNHPEGGRHGISMALLDECFNAGLTEDQCIEKMARWFAANDMAESRIKDFFHRIVPDRYKQTKEKSFGCYSTEKQTFCSRSCTVFAKLDENRQKQTAFTKEEAEMRDNPYANIIASGFHTKKTDKEGSVTIKAQPEMLKDYFNYVSPYISLKESNITSVWNGTHYTDVSNIEIKMFAHHFFKPPPSIKLTNEFLARIQHTNAKSLDWFKETTNNKINLLNGVFNTEDGTFEPGHSPNRGFKYCLPYGYDPLATAPMFEQMLGKVTSGDKERAQVILEFIGYALSGSPCFADKVMVMFGEGSNGKTRFLNVIRAIMGGTAAVGLKAKDFDKDVKLKKLDSSLLAVIEEMPAFAQKDFWESIKDLASGGELTVDVKFKDAISFANRCKLIFTCNKLPLGTDPTHGFFRRLILVPFDHEFKPTDKDFTPNIDNLIIDSELPGVFNLIWKAFKQLKGNKYRFSESAEVRKQINAYKTDVDSVAQWVSESEISFTDIGETEVEKKKDPYTPVLTLFADYQVWGEERDIKTVGFSEYGRRLVRSVKGIEKRHARRVVGNKKMTVYLGVSLIDPTESNDAKY